MNTCEEVGPARRIRFIGTILTLAFVLPAVSLAQSSPAPVNLGTAADFVILAKTGITTTGTSHVSGDIGISPAAASFITGFGLIADASNAFSTSLLVNGKAFAASYTSPTPAKMTAAIGDMQTAYTNAAGRTSPDFTELFSGDLTGKTLTRGLYKWSTGVLVSAAGVTISGSGTDVWIFQVAQDLTLAGGANVTLSGGAQASNIFWQVAGRATLGTSAAMKGNILCQAAIAMNTGATLNGRALAQTAVILDGNAVSQSAAASSVENGTAPREFALQQNHPNPFNPSTMIQYSLVNPSHVSLKVYNLLGNDIATLVQEHQGAGNYTVAFNINSGAFVLPSGVYFYRLEAGSFVSTKKLVIMK